MQPKSNEKNKMVSYDMVRDFASHLLAGGLAACVSKTIIAPVERTKLLIQTSKYQNFSMCLKEIPKEEGFPWTLWRGNAINVIRYFPLQALNFAFNDLYKGVLIQKNNNFTEMKIFWLNLLAGGIAGGTSQMLVYPLDLARTRISSDNAKKVADKQYKGLVDCLTSTVKKEGGIKSLYKGCGISLLGIVPYRAIFFGGYDSLKRIFLKNEKEATFWQKWLLSQTNTVVAQMIIYPVDTVCRNKMINEKVELTTKECVQNIWRKYGIKGFWKGAMLNTVRATGGALCLIFYDILEVAMNNKK